ncbi:hypothetical protein PMAYCL1PPCAC_22429, partial [Pristionchus mayeri]
MTRWLRIFVNNMNALTADEDDKLNRFVRMKLRAVIYWRHMKELPPDEGERGQSATSNETQE